MQFGYNYVKVDPFTATNAEVIAIHVIDIVDYIYGYMDWNDTYDEAKVPKGNIIDKVKYIAEEKGMSEEQLQGVIEVMNSMFQEITKEEYESMITYKP